MKTIYYFFIACFIYVITGFSNPKASQNIILQSANSGVSVEALTQSAGIIKERLKTCNIESSVSIIPEKKQIKVQIPDDIIVSDISDLLTLKGDLGFYETLTAWEIDDLSKNLPKNTSHEAKLGCSTSEDKHVADSVENILVSLKLASDYKLLWDLNKGKSMTCLYAVKNDPELTKADIENIRSSRDKNSQAITIFLKFKESSAKKWSELTGKSLYKPVAIVLDNKVYYAPLVKTSIENGLCEITGNFTQKEVNYFLALVNNHNLPVALFLK